MDKKQELLINAAKIIHEDGVQNFTMEALAKKSNITKGGVLYHFKSKSDLLLRMNEFVIEQFEMKMNHYVEQLHGSYVFTRAYGHATIDYIQNEQNILLPAVFITSLEDKSCKALWDQTLHKWNKAFDTDKGNKQSILTFRLICDGVWFSITYDFTPSSIQQVTKLLQYECEKLTTEEY